MTEFKMKLELTLAEVNVLYEEIGDLPQDLIRKFTWENASRLYGHPVPLEIQRDPEAF